MHLPFLYRRPVESKQTTIEHTFDPVHDPNAYTNEGSEFLDDAIRMKDQPLQYTEQCITVGSPEYLL